MKHALPPAAIVAVVLIACGCATLQTYEGPRLPADAVAVVSGDAKLRAQTPLALVIRSVDERSVDLRYSSVALAPGAHHLIVDCQIAASIGTASRHALDVEVAAGARYRLRADMRPGNRSCERVYLQRS